MKITKILTKLYMIPLAVVTVFLVYCSITRSTYFELNLELETPSYMKDPVWLMLLVLVLSLVIMWAAYLIVRRDRVSVGAFRTVSLLWSGLLSSLAIWVYRCGVTADAMHVNSIALDLLDGNYNILNTNEYLKIYPYQIYMAEYIRLIYSIFGRENYVAVQVINVIFIMLLVFALMLITHELFENEKADKWIAVISMLYFPLYLYSTLCYGDIPGLCLGAWAIYFTVRYLKSDRWINLVPVAFLFCFAIIVKENSKILLMAFGIIMLLKCFTDKKWGRLLFAAAVVIIGLSGTFTIKQITAKKAGLENFPEGTPTLSWVVMGIQDSNEATTGCGWYNGYTINIYKEYGGDVELANAKSIDAIKEAAIAKIQDPKHAVYYYFRKFNSSWNDPSFMMQQLTEWNSRHIDNRTKVTDFFIYGQGRTILFWIMNFTHMIIVFWAAVGAIAVIKNWSLERAYLLLNVLGGLLFHEFVWETSGRYVHPYYVLLMPVAGYGLYVGYSFISEKVCLFHKGK